jgi:phosphatidylglycerophosphatase C
VNTLVPCPRDVYQPLALFDFDGTITNRDIFFDFIAYCMIRGVALPGLIPSLVPLFLFGVGVYGNERAKEKIFKRLFGGRTVKELNALATRYHEKNLNRRVRVAAAERIKWHNNQGHRVVIISSNIDLIIRPAAEKLGAELICTVAAIEQDVVTGSFATPNCHGVCKVERLRTLFPDLDRHYPIYGYGDSSGDTEMLKISTIPAFQPFRS